jgi:hypothetical protein
MTMPATCEFLHFWPPSPPPPFRPISSLDTKQQLPGRGTHLAGSSPATTGPSFTSFSPAGRFTSFPGPARSLVRPTSSPTPGLTSPSESRVLASSEVIRGHWRSLATLHLIAIEVFGVSRMPWASGVAVRYDSFCEAKRPGCGCLGRRRTVGTRSSASRREATRVLQHHGAVRIGRPRRPHGDVAPMPPTRSSSRCNQDSPIAGASRGTSEALAQLSDLSPEHLESCA